MAESKPGPTHTSSDKEVKAPNIFERAKEEIEAVLHTHHHHKETHGMRDDIDESTPLYDVKAPNVFERAKEEIEAVVEAIRENQKSPTDQEQRDQSLEVKNKPKKSENDEKAPNLIERAKEEIEAIFHHEKSPHHHHKETHGRSDDFDENTPINEIKGPSVVERAKEELEAIVEAIHPKNESSYSISSP